MGRKMSERGKTNNSRELFTTNVSTRPLDATEAMASGNILIITIIDP